MKRTQNTLALKSLVAALALAGFAGWADAGPVTDSMLAENAGDSGCTPMAAGPVGAITR